MRPPQLLPFLGLLALLPNAAWSGLGTFFGRSAPADSARPGDWAPSAKATVEKVLPRDAFRNFILENRRFEDSIHYQRGEQAFGQEEFDVALGHHLAADLPADGIFREDLLAQRSRIFARIWPSAASADNTGKEDTRRTAFDWDLGTGHSRANYRTGPLFPFGENGFGSESRDWMYNANARESWPVSLGKQGLELALSANADRSSARGASDYAASVDAATTDGILNGLLLSFSTGITRSRILGSYRYNGFSASKTWNLEGIGAGLDGGYSRQWDGGWKRLSDNAWTRLSRDFGSKGGNSIDVSLLGAVSRMKPQADRYIAPVWYVDNVALAHPSHFQGPDFADTVALNGLNSFLESDPHSRVMSLNLDAPQTYFSFAPEVSYGFSPFAAWQARAGASYALDIYPEYAWDRVTLPANLDPYSSDQVGLAFNRADGRYYTAALVEQDGGYREYYGTLPLERRKMRRVDNRVGLDFSLVRKLPRGYFLSVESGAELQWSNLPNTAPAAFNPWQWRLALDIGRNESLF